MQTKAESWKKVLSEYQASGQSVKAFCRERGIATSTLQYWCEKAGIGKERARFARVETSDRIELELSSGVSIRVSRGDLRSVLEALCER